MKGTKKVDLDGHDVKTLPNVEGSTVIIETAASADGFKRLMPTKGIGTISANQESDNDSVATLGDGKLVKGFGPIFKNGVNNGAYKMDLGSVQPVSAITSWSFNQKGFRGVQKLLLYGSNAQSDPG